MTRTSTLASAALVLVACGGGELAVESPLDGAVLTTTTDTNGALPGVQARVVVVSRGLATGAGVDLRVDGAVVATLPVPESERLVFEDVTLSGGERTIDAAASGAVAAPVSVRVIDTCFAVAFASPTAPSGTLALGADDDTDGEPCGATFETSFEITTDAADGSEARVLVDGAPRRTAAVFGGRARFEGVPFDRRGAESAVRAEVTDATTGQVCGAAFGAPVTIDCEGVSCAIVLPDPGARFLGPGDDVSEDPGFQIDVEVLTDAAADGQPVRLVIDGVESEALTATASGGQARWAGLTFTEGVHRLRAICQDGRGNVTYSSSAEWTIDVTPCELELTWPEDGETFPYFVDFEESTPERELFFEGRAGADCALLRAASCDSIEPLPFEAASPFWYRLLVFETEGTYSMCAEALDAAGNASSAMVTVEVLPAP